jgi:hypothetical protein
MATQTLTLTTTGHSQWKVLPSLKAYQDSREELVGILKTFKAWDDILSVRLHQWGARVVSTSVLTPGSAKADLELFQTKMEGFLEELQKKILVNPLNEKYSLELPVRDRKQTWEKWALDQYRQRTKRSDSPYDKQPIEEQPHLFARAMIAFLKALRREEPSTSPWNYLVPEISSEGITPMQLQDSYSLLYQNLAQRTISRQILRGLVDSAADMVVEGERRTAESKECTAKEKEKNGKRLDHLVTTFKEGMATNTKAHKEETARLREKQQLLAEKQEKLDQEIEKMKEQIAKQEEQIQRLDLENEQRRREIAALNARLDDDSSCPLM